MKSETKAKLGCWGAFLAVWNIPLILWALAEAGHETAAGVVLCALFMAFGIFVHYGEDTSP